MLRKFFKKFGMNVLTTFRGLPKGNKYALSEILIKYNDEKWYTIKNKLPRSARKDVSYKVFNPQYFYNTYKKYCEVVNNIYLFEKLRISVACFDIDVLFDNIKLEAKIYNDNMKIENRIPTILNIDLRTETHTVLLYREDNFISIINCYGGMGTVVTKRIEYEEYLSSIENIANSTKEGNKNFTKFYISKLFGIKLIYDDYEYIGVEKKEFMMDERTIIKRIIDILNELLPVFENREDGLCLKRLILDIEDFIRLY